MQSAYILILILATLGLGVAYYIHRTKKRYESLVCPLGADCDSVVRSKYSKIFGVPLEVFGILYYLAIIILSIFEILNPTGLSIGMILVSLAMSAGACLFSLYLLVVQLFLLKEFCTWCILSSLVSMLIFLILIFEHQNAARAVIDYILP